MFMLIEYLNLKKTPYYLQIIESDELVTLSHDKFEINKTLIPLSINTNKIIFFSFILGIIVRLSREDYEKYIKNFHRALSIPKILLDYNFIVEKKSLPRIPRKKYTPTLQLVLTRNCNLRCLYCFARSGRRQDIKTMSFKIAKAAIDFISKYNKKELNLEFVGAGENTLEFSLLKKIFAYARKKIVNVIISPFSTNGVFSRNIANWLIKNVSNLQISCDGPAFLQDKYRPLANGKGSSKFVEKTIKYLVKEGKPFRIRTTMTYDFYGNELKVINYFWQLGVKDISFGPLDTIGEGKYLTSEKSKVFVTSSDLSELYPKLMKLAELQHELGLPITLLRFNHLGSTMTCPIYTKSSFTVDPEGNVAACERYTGPSDLQEYPFMKDLLIGFYDKKTKKIKVNFRKLNNLTKIIDNQLKINQCLSCPLFSACSTICLYSLGQKYGTINPQEKSCNEDGKLLNYAVFDYLSQYYFINKKPCLEYKNNKLFYSLFYTDFELSISKNGRSFKKNPYLVITDTSLLPTVARNIINYKNSRQELTVFLIKFKFKKNEINFETGKRIEKFLQILKNNRVYYKITEPLPKNIWGIRYNLLNKNFGVPLTFRDCLELYRVINDEVYFSDNIKGSKKFSEYQDREEIYQDFLSKLQINNLK